MVSHKPTLPNWTSELNEQKFLLVLATSTQSDSKLQEAAQYTADTLFELGFCCVTHKLPTHQGVAQFVFRAPGRRASQAWALICGRLEGIDVWIRPLDAKPIKLIMCDMDSTIIPTESLDELAAEVGIGEQVAAITTRAMNGELDFAEALDQRVGLLKGLDVAVIDRCVAQTQINPGAEELIRAARADGVFTVLISGGFEPFVQHVAERLGFDRWVANTLEIEADVLTGRVLAPLIDKHSKLMILKEEIERLGATPEQTVAVGDGANDVAMLQHSGYGLAYHAKRTVLEHTPYHVQNADFDRLLSFLPLGNTPDSAS